MCVGLYLFSVFMYENSLRDKESEVIIMNAYRLWNFRRLTMHGAFRELSEKSHTWLHVASRPVHFFTSCWHSIQLDFIVFVQKSRWRNILTNSKMWFVLFQCQLHQHPGRHPALQKSTRALHPKESDTRPQRDMLAEESDQAEKLVAGREPMRSRRRTVSLWCSTFPTFQ